MERRENKRHIVLFRNQKQRENTVTTSAVWGCEKGQQSDRERDGRWLERCEWSDTKVDMTGTRGLASTLGEREGGRESLHTTYDYNSE